MQLHKIVRLRFTICRIKMRIKKWAYHYNKDHCLHVTSNNIVIHMRYADRACLVTRRKIQTNRYTSGNTRKTSSRRDNQQ